MFLAEGDELNWLMIPIEFSILWNKALGVISSNNGVAVSVMGSAIPIKYCMTICYATLFKFGYLFLTFKQIIISDKMGQPQKHDSFSR